jgi:hypothetical protein
MVVSANATRTAESAFATDASRVEHATANTQAMSHSWRRAKVDRKRIMARDTT